MLNFILYLLAFLALALSGFGVAVGRLNLPMIGAALLVLALLLIPAGEAVW